MKEVKIGQKVRCIRKCKANGGTATFDVGYIGTVFNTGGMVGRGYRTFWFSDMVGNGNLTLEDWEIIEEQENFYII